MVMAAAKIAPSDAEERSRENSATENTRQCVVCRGELPPAQLLALGFIGQQLVYERVGGQRGAYVCPTKNCLSKLSTAQVSRAFRRNVKTDGLGELVKAAHSLANRRIGEALGLCRRQGVVQVGVDALKGDSPEGAVRIIASDLSQNSARQIREASVFGTSEQLGQCLGMNKVGALSISPGPMANRVAFWLRLWQETFVDGQSGAK